MRNVNARNVAVVFSATLAFLLIQVSDPVLGDQAMAIVTVATMALEPLISSMLSDLRTRQSNEEVTAKMWMHTGDTRLNGCGFYFRVEGHSGRSAQDWFPSRRTHKCGNEEYRMRMTSQSAAYDNTVRLGNDQVRKIEVHADGWHNTFVKAMCFGLAPHTIVAGPRAFCVNVQLLKACKTAKNKWGDINLEFNDILLTRTTRGAHKIIFHDIENLINAYEAVGGNVNDESAADVICDKIELVRGGDSDDSWVCQADLTWTRATGAGMFYSWETKYKRQDKSPYGCNRYDGSK